MGAYTIKKCFTDDKFIYPVEVDIALDSFLEYINSTEKAIIVEIKKTVEYYEDLIKQLQDDNEHVVFPFIDYETKANISHLYYSSLIITIYSFLEQKMLTLCEIAEKNVKVPISSINGSGIFKYREYMKNVLNIDFSKVLNEWEKITQFNKLRNFLVHKSFQKIIKRNNENKINSIKQIENLKITDFEDYIEIKIEDSTTIKFFIKAIRKLLNTVYYRQVIFN